MMIKTMSKGKISTEQRTKRINTSTMLWLKNWLCPSYSTSIFLSAPSMVDLGGTALEEQKIVIKLSLNLTSSWTALSTHTMSLIGLKRQRDWTFLPICSNRSGLFLWMWTQPLNFDTSRTWWKIMTRTWRNSSFSVTACLLTPHSLETTLPSSVDTFLARENLTALMAALWWKKWELFRISMTWGRTPNMGLFTIITNLGSAMLREDLAAC